MRNAFNTMLALIAGIFGLVFLVLCALVDDVRYIISILICAIFCLFYCVRYFYLVIKKG